jgi:hypothetical protein
VLPHRYELQRCYVGQGLSRRFTLYSHRDTGHPPRGASVALFSDDPIGGEAHARGGVLCLSLFALSLLEC